MDQSTSLLPLQEKRIILNLQTVPNATVYVGIEEEVCFIESRVIINQRVS